MKHIFKALSLSVIIFAFNVDAGLITDYYLDGNIVKNDARNIEWLQWTETDGMSINSALAVYQSQGWELATQQNMADLFNDFDLSYGNFVWDAVENSSQGHVSGSDGVTEAVDDRELMFVQLFGDTYEEFSVADGFCGEATADCLQYSSAFFGIDEDGDGRYGVAEVLDDYGSGTNWKVQSQSGFTNLYRDGSVPSGGSDARGVALVRATMVSAPQTATILSFALLVLMARRRKCQ